MSYDLYINKLDGTQYPFDNHLKGGTYALNGCGYAWLNITYNYSKFYMIGFEGFENGLRDLNGKTVEETLPYLKELTETLKGVPSDNYWDGTEGNALKAIQDLYCMALYCRDGIWEVC